MRISGFSFGGLAGLLVATATSAQSPIEISAACGSGTPSAFAPGASASTRDGSIYYVDWANGSLSYKIARNVPLVARWHETLERMGFEQIRYGDFGQPWCGIIRSADGGQHAVRWPTAVNENGSLAHNFEGMPAEVWFVYLEMQQVAVNGEVCANAGDAYEVTDSIALQCPGPGGEPTRAELRVLSDGDFIASRLQAAPHQQCSTVIGHHPRALEQWHAVLDEAELEELPDHDPLRPDRTCTLERTRGGVTHRVHLGTQRPADSRWMAVDTVVNELAVMSGGRLGVTATGQGSEVRRFTLLDALTARAAAAADVLVASDNGIRCIAAPCPTDRVEWRGRTDSSGTVLVPARFVTEMTAIGTRAHDARSVSDAVRGPDGALVLELIPLELPSDDSLGLGLTPVKLVDAASGAAIADAKVHVAAEGTVGLELESNALGYIFIDEGDFDVLLEELRVSVPGYRRRSLGFDLVAPLRREPSR
jgi:hypothetical protein